MWTLEKQQQLASLAAQAMTARQIGDAIGFSRCAVIGRARRTGVKLRDPSPGLDPKITALVLALYADGVSYSQIAKQTGIGGARIAVLTAGLPRRNLRADAQVNRSALTKLRALVSIVDGEKRPSVAKRLGVGSHVFHWWEREPGLLDKAREIVRRRNARAEAVAARGAAEHAIRVALINEPILASRPPRERIMAMMKLGGSSGGQIARAFGISRGRVHQILRHLRNLGGVL